MRVLACLFVVVVVVVVVCVCTHARERTKIVSTDKILHFIIIIKEKGDVFYIFYYYSMF